MEPVEEKQPAELDEAEDTVCYQQYYSMEDVEAASYNDGAEDCWFILYDDVYNMTGYIEDDLHPGGSDKIIMECGYGNVTEFYLEEKKHDQDLLEKEGMEVYVIGKVANETALVEVACEEE